MIQVPLADPGYLPVREGDLVGFRNDATVGLIGVKPSAPVGYYVRNVEDIDIGTTATFERVYLPYRFAVAVVFKPGWRTADTIMMIIYLHESCQFTLNYGH